MAKKRRKYSRGSGEEVRREMHRYKRGRAKSGRGGKGGKVKKSQTSDRHCTVQGTQERKESSPKEALRHSLDGNATESITWALDGGQWTGPLPMISPSRSVSTPSLVRLTISSDGRHFPRSPNTASKLAHVGLVLANKD
jgi:hypothetical protein